MPAIKKIVARYYCENNQHHRVFPYDGYETLTLAPEPGKKGNGVLLFSFNSARKDGTKWGYCWACESWVVAHRRTQHQVLLDYVRRTDVLMRVAGGERQLLLALQQRIEQKRAEHNDRGV